MHWGRAVAGARRGKASGPSCPADAEDLALADARRRQRREGAATDGGRGRGREGRAVLGQAPGRGRAHGMGAVARGRLLRHAAVVGVEGGPGHGG